MAEFNLAVKFTRMRRPLAGLPERFARRLTSALRRVGLEFLERLKLERFGGRPALQRRTGEMSRSFDLEILGSRLSDLVLRVFSRSKQAKIQEYGGTVRPVNAAWLAIPLDAAKTAAGVARGGPRDFKNTFFATSKNGNLILFQRLGKDKAGRQKRRTFQRTPGGAKEKSEIVPLFAMKKEVTIPPRLGMRELWRRMAPERNAILKQAMSGLKKA